MSDGEEKADIEAQSESAAAESESESTPPIETETSKRRPQSIELIADLNRSWFAGMFSPSLSEQELAMWPKQFTLRRGERLRIGSLVSNDLVIKEPSVSSFHAVISVLQSEVDLTNLTLPGRTYCNRRRVIETVRLNDGDLLQIGNVSISVLIPEGMYDRESELAPSISGVGFNKKTQGPGLSSRAYDKFLSLLFHPYLLFTIAFLFLVFVVPDWLPEVHGPKNSPVMTKLMSWFDRYSQPGVPIGNIVSSEPELPELVLGRGAIRDSVALWWPKSSRLDLALYKMPLTVSHKAAIVRAKDLRRAGEDPVMNVVLHLTPDSPACDLKFAESCDIRFFYKGMGGETPCGKPVDNSIRENSIELTRCGVNGDNQLEGKIAGQYTLTPARGGTAQAGIKIRWNIPFSSTIVDTSLDENSRVAHTYGYPPVREGFVGALRVGTQIINLVEALPLYNKDLRMLYLGFFDTAISEEKKAEVRRNRSVIWSTQLVKPRLVMQFRLAEIADRFDAKTISGYSAYYNDPKANLDTIHGQLGAMIAERQGDVALKKDVSEFSGSAAEGQELTALVRGASLGEQGLIYSWNLKFAAPVMVVR